MTEGLGALLVRRRAELGISATELAERAGITKSDVSAIERGRVGLPTTEKRRRLASALGLSHLDLLIAAGELQAEEVVDAGKAAPQPDDQDETRRLLELARQVDWRRDTLAESWHGLMESMLRKFIADQRKGGDAP